MANADDAVKKKNSDEESGNEKKRQKKHSGAPVKNESENTRSGEVFDNSKLNDESVEAAEPPLKTPTRQSENEASEVQMEKGKTEEEKAPDEKAEKNDILTTGAAFSPQAKEALVDERSKTLVEEKSTSAASSSADIHLLSSVPVTLTLSVDSKKMLISDVLELAPGSVIQLDRKEYEPLDISLNGTLFAKGEVVLIGENYGLRILEIL